MPLNEDKLKTKFITMSDQLAELGVAMKEMQTAQNADAVMPIDYDPNLVKRIIQQTPVTEWLKKEGCMASTNSVKVGYKEKTNNTNAAWMNEDDAFATATAAGFAKKYVPMRILAYPISIGDLALKGGEFNLQNDELDDGKIDIANQLDKTILEGSGTEEAKDFKGIFKSINTNTVKLGGDLLTKDDLTSLFQGIIEEGGFPSGLICTAEVGDQINDMYYPGTQKELTLDLIGGYTVTGIKTTAGNVMPVIVDRNIDNTNGEKLAVIDSSSYKLRELMAPSVMPLAKTKLATDEALVQFITGYMDAEFKNGMITGIGKDTDRPSLTKTGDVSFGVVGTDGKPVKGAKVKFTKGDNVFTSNATNNRGLAEMIQVPYDTYTVAFETVPTGYTSLATYADFEITSNTSSVQLVLTKN